MNEWSPGGNYPRPVTPNQQGQMRSIRPPWDEPIPERKPLVVNIRAVSDSRSKPTFQQRSTEDISRTSLLSGSRKKKSLSGTSDPRFKKVLSPSSQKDAGVGTELKSARMLASTVEEESEKPELINSKTDYQCGDVLNKDKSVKAATKIPDFKNLRIPQETLNFDVNVDHLKEVEKLSFNPDIVFPPKKSVSDCTIRTRNTSYGSDDIADDYLTRLQTSPSATRVTKVHNWIRDQKPKAEKRRSVITVIGQTQGPPPLSSTLQEIDQRKKLAKELDKHALCKKLITTDKDKELNNLISKINFITAPAKITPGGDRMFGLSDFSYDCGNLNLKDYGGSGEKKAEWAGGMIDGVCGEANDRPNTSGTSSKRSNEKKHSSKKSNHTNILDVRDKIGQHLDHLSAQWLVYFMVILSGALCWFTFFSLQQNNSLFHLDWFPMKPRTTTWYEKLLNWIWEVFRPAGSYRRSTSWNAR